MTNKLKILLLIFFTTSIIGNAQEIFVNITPKKSTFNELKNLSVEIKGDSRTQVDIPQFENDNQFDYKFIGQGSSLNVLNGVTSFTTIFSYRIDPKNIVKPGKYYTPKGKVQYGNIILEIPKTTFEITKSLPKRNSAKGLDGDLDLVLKQSLSNYSPYIGEQVLYKMMINAGSKFKESSNSILETEGFLVEEFDKRNATKSIRSGSSITFYLNHALFPLYEGKAKIKPRRINASFQDNNFNHRGGVLGLFDSPFGNRHSFPSLKKTQTKTYVAKGIEVDVKSLPKYDKKWDNYIPVGNIEVYSGVSSGVVEVGKSIDLAITVKGNGNLRPLELADFYGKDLDNFEIYIADSKLKITNISEKLFHSKEFVVSLVPKKGGNLEIPQTKFVFFNPRSHKYYEVETPSEKINVIDTSIIKDSNIAQEEDLPKLKDGEIVTELKPIITHSSSSINSKFYLNYFIFVIPLLFLFYLLVIDKRKKDRVFRKKARASVLKDFNKYLRSNNLEDFFNKFNSATSTILAGEDLNLNYTDLKELLIAAEIKDKDRELALEYWKDLYEIKYKPSITYVKKDHNKARDALEILDKYLND